MNVKLTGTIACCFFLCLFTGSLYAQLNKTFSKGVVVFQNGDTLHGFIRNDELGKMNYRVAFRLSEADNHTAVYDTASVKKILLDEGDVFELLKFSEEESGIQVAALAKLIVRGKASLYKVVYKSDETFYPVSVNDSLYLLRNDKKDAGMTATDQTFYHFKDILFGALAGAGIAADYVERMSFTQSDISNVISMYNKSMGGENTMVASRETGVHYIIVGAGGMIKSSQENEIYLEAIYRTYFPKISNGTSLNFGIHYYNYRYTETVGTYYSRSTANYRSTLVTVPVYLQQNILNKNIRPFLFAGLNASYWRVTDQYGTVVAGKGIQGNFGIAFLFGGGVELSVYKGLTLNAGYRYENYSHLALAGISYIATTGKRK